MPSPSVIKFINWITGSVVAMEDAMANALGLPLPSNLSTALQAAVNAVVTLPVVFVASGPSHATGLVPDPGSTAGTSRVLREDATFALPFKIVTQEFTGSGTYTPTAGMFAAIIDCIGPGGGGGGCVGLTNVTNGGGGGGAGAYSRAAVTKAQVGASQTVTVGSGGGGAAAGNNAGAAGTSATSVGSLCSANAGQGGAAGNGSTTVGGGGAGGSNVGGIGDSKRNGANGWNAIFASGGTSPPAIIMTHNAGAPSVLGGGGITGNIGSGTTANGSNANIPGAGGSGGATNNHNGGTGGGGNGGGGIVIILEFCSV